MIGGPILSVYPGLDQDMLPLALVVVILGGSGSLLGSLAGSFVVGFLYNFRPGDVPRARLRRPFPAHAHRAGGAATGPVRPGHAVKRLALAIALLLLATVPYWIGNSYYINVATQILIYAVLALGLNVLVGYAGLVTLGHASLFGIAAYAGATLINAGQNQIVVAIGALLATLAATAIFALLALRGTGLGFVMITVALGQIVWGIAYRWISLTNGDNGMSISTRPSPFGLSLDIGRCVLLGDARRVPERGRRHGDLRRIAVRRSRTRHARPAKTHDRARLQCVADALPRLPVLWILERRRGACCISTTTSSSVRRPSR